MKTISRISFVLVLGLVFLGLALPYAVLSGIWHQLGLGWVEPVVQWLKTARPGLSLDHLVAFVAVGALCRVALPRVPARLALLGLVLLAVGTEAVQVFVPGREAHLGDALMDLVGGVAGYAAVAGVARLVRRNKAR